MSLQDYSKRRINTIMKRLNLCGELVFKLEAIKFPQVYNQGQNLGRILDDLCVLDGMPIPKGIIEITDIIKDDDTYSITCRLESDIEYYDIKENKVKHKVITREDFRFDIITELIYLWEKDEKKLLLETFIYKICKTLEYNSTNKDYSEYINVFKSYDVETKIRGWYL